MAAGAKFSTKPKISPPKKSDRGSTRKFTSPTAKQQDAFNDEADEYARTERARAVLAEDRAITNRAKNAKITRSGGDARGRRHVNDSPPPGSRRSGAPPPARRSSTMRDINRSLRRFGGGNPRRVLVAELVLALAIVTIAEITDDGDPTPSAFVAPFVVYLSLAFLAEFGDDSARLAAGLGGLVLLTLVLNRAGGLVKALEYVAGTTAKGGPPKAPRSSRKGVD